eukprot:2057893-Lingulodinium_polyedra.AAC.1
MPSMVRMEGGSMAPTAGEARKRWFRRFSASLKAISSSMDSLLGEAHFVEVVELQQFAQTGGFSR